MQNAKQLAADALAEGFKSAVAKSFENLLINVSARQEETDALDKLVAGVERMLHFADEAIKAVDAKSNSW